MQAKLQYLRLLNGHRISALLAVTLILLAALIGFFGTANKVYAESSSTLNFQARLMNGDGSVVPDGKYSVEFKLYSSEYAGASTRGVCDGDCVWMETRTADSAVSVTNGYVAVNLGDVAPFGNKINWNQELWLTMNIGGIGSIPKWDGEMTPRLKLTAVPYAFEAGQLTNQEGENRSTLGFDTQTGSNEILLPDESGVLCIQGSEDCGFVQQGEGGAKVTGTLGVSVLGAADTANFLCYNRAGQIAACDISGSMDALVGVLNATNLVFSGETQVFSVDGAVVGVDTYTTIAVDAEADGLRVEVPSLSPAKQKVGRVLYVTAVADSGKFTLVLDGTEIEISMQVNDTAALLWNGNGWTVASASASNESDDNEPYLGSMYYDATTGAIQCYEDEGWGACVAAPDNIVTLSPEYAGSVVNGEGTGILSTGFCSNDDDLMINAMLCEVGKANNFYQWTSFEPTAQTRSIYISYQLPANFKGFASDDTVRLNARVDDATNATVTYEMYRSDGTDIIQCSTGGATDVIIGGGGETNVWHNYGISGYEATECGFDETAAGSTIIFKINLTASNMASAYVGALSFVTTTRH